jgi:hypothetical protein
MRKFTLDHKLRAIFLHFDTEPWFECVPDDFLGGDLRSIGLLLHSKQQSYFNVGGQLFGIFYIRGYEL